MRFSFKTLDYQTRAAESVARVFEGQPRASAGTNFTAGGALYDASGQSLMLNTFVGSGNSEILLSDEELDANIAKVQRGNNIRRERRKQGEGAPLGRVTLDVEMETGTGKTYVYTKAIYELNRRYGWTKFIIVTPSIAIREGVRKSFSMTKSHFFAEYGTKVRYFVYSGANLTDIQTFASSADINVMIINTQAFAASFNEENRRSKVSRIIYSKRDNFGSFRPIDIIAATRPILILDEPQKMGKEGSVTQRALRSFAPLFSLNCSATHAVHHRTIYTLDALDAYNQKLVKRIEVKELEAKNLPGCGKYMYLGEILVSSSEAPRARIELEISYASGICREYRILRQGADLYTVSHGLEEYRGLVISEVNAHEGTVKFTNGYSIKAGIISGDNTEMEMRRIQIRETIISHLEKEQSLFAQGIKTLSLFFIDRVEHYRSYDSRTGAPEPGEYAKIFEEEYAAAVRDMRGTFPAEYCKYLDRFAPSRVHKGYFSIDKKGRSINSKTARGKDTSDDISAYDLILKDKERLLSFEEPTRFIFSHSALREGWDNPNIFQICFLKKGGDSRISKRQEIGRGMRIAVNRSGERMDESACAARGLDVHDVNLLTVIAGESYADFASGLQDEIRDALAGRPERADESYFTGQVIVTRDGREIKISESLAHRISDSLYELKYVDAKGMLTDEYHKDAKNRALKLYNLPKDMQEIAPEIKALLEHVVDPRTVKELINKKPVVVTDGEPLNERFNDRRFQEFWREINHKYRYKVDFDSGDLVKSCIEAIDTSLNVGALRYDIRTYKMKDKITDRDLLYHAGFKDTETESFASRARTTHRVRYDLVSRLASATKLKRKTIVAIMQGIAERKFAMFARNPEEFIKRCIELIGNEKAKAMRSHIVYTINTKDGRYSRKIFEDNKRRVESDRIVTVKKSIQDHIYTDSNVERKFTQDLERSHSVALYAKLPRGFSIPTPVGRYSPDWAIIFDPKSGIRKIYFVAETKGTMSEIELREEESVKIACARKLFEQLFADKDIRYEQVDSFESLMNLAFN